MIAAHMARLRSLFSLLIVLLPVVLFAAPRELLVRLRHAPSRSHLDQITLTRAVALDGLMAQGHAAVVSPFTGLTNRFPEIESVVTVRPDNSVNVDSLENALANDPEVEWVTRNHVYSSNDFESINSVTPNDTLYSQEWWLPLISAPLAWELTTGDTSVILGIIDTGIDYLHPDLRPNLWRSWAEVNGLPGVDDDNNGFVDDSIGWDFVDAPSLPAPGDYLGRDSDPFDEMGHGTYVAGLAAAATNNQLCFASVGYHCRIMALRAGDSQGFLEEDDIAAAMLYAAQMGASVINMSFGDTVASPLLRETCRIVHDAGLVMVASGGNLQTAHISYPAGFTDVIAVGATDRFNRIASFSNFGPTISVFAPGVDVRSTFPLFTDSTIEHQCGSWLSNDGTSFAAPQVTAAAGLMLSVNAQLSADEVKQIIRSTAGPVRLVYLDPNSTTAGLLNVRRAVEVAQHSADVFARIISPRTDDGVSASFAVRADAWGATFDRWILQYGSGESPDEWFAAASGTQREYGDSLAQIPVPDADGVLIVRLTVYGTDGSVSADQAHLFVQHSTPRLDSLHVRPMLDYDSYGELVDMQTNQSVLASFLLHNEFGDSAREDFGYVSTEPTAFLSQREHPGLWQVQVQLMNRAGMPTFSPPFTFAANTPPFRSNLWTRTETSLPHGHLAPFTTDYNCDGRPEVWLLPIGANDTIENPLQIYEWNGADFEATGNTYGVHIPRALGDANQNGLLEMMATFSDSTIIWEQSEPCHVFNHVVFSAPTNFVGGAFLDVDSTDGHGEILAKVNTENFGHDAPRYGLFSVGANYTLTPRDTLPNLTEGQNGLGQPAVLIGDLDHDGALDFVYGDYDGDVIFCEMIGGHPSQKWTTRLPLNDATMWLAEGDLDGDGLPEFVAGCRSNAAATTESEARNRHWEYFIFKATGDDQFAALDSVFILGNESVNAHPASVTCADVDGDGIAEILISAYPDFYLIGRDPISHRWVPHWYDTPSESNNILARDWNGNGIAEFLYSDGAHFVRAEAASAIGNRPLPPASLTGEPLGPISIMLAWNSVERAQIYNVYDRRNTEAFTLIASVAETTFTLTDAPQDVVFSYAVTSVDSSFPQPESVYSNDVQLAANEPPSVQDTAEFTPPHFVCVRFSEAMGPSALFQWSYHLLDGRMPAVIAEGEGGRVVNLAFDGDFVTGTHNLILSGLRDAQNTRLPASMNRILFVVAPPAATSPHIASHKLLGGPAVTDVEIQFTQAMSSSALDPANYRMDAPRRVLSVSRATTETFGVIAHLDPHYPVGALGREAWMYLRNLYSQGGVPLDTTEGANLNLVAPAETVDDAYVYPNPYKGIGPDGGRSVFFAGLPEQATIRIFTLQGIHMRTLEHSNLMGAERWDLANDKGDEVAGGVYLYTIESAGKTVRGKLAVLR